MFGSSKGVKFKKLDDDGGADKYEVEGMSSTVDEIHRIDQAVEELENQRDVLRSMMMVKIQEIKREEELKGNLFKTFVVKSQNTSPAVILFKNVFSKLDKSNEEELRKTLKEDFDILFTFDQSTAMKKNVSLDELKRALGDKFDVYFETKEFIAFAKNFMEQRASVRSRLNNKVNATLDKLIEDCQAKPDLRMK